MIDSLFVESHSPGFPRSAVHHRMVHKSGHTTEVDKNTVIHNNGRGPRKLANKERGKSNAGAKLWAGQSSGTSANQCVL